LNRPFCPTYCDRIERKNFVDNKAVAFLRFKDQEHIVVKVDLVNGKITKIEEEKARMEVNNMEENWRVKGTLYSENKLGAF